MEIINKTPFEFGLAPAFAPGLPKAVVLVVKGTFEVHAEGRSSVAETQDELLVADELHEGTEYQSVRLEAEMAPFKPRADIIVVGQAHAPKQRQVTALKVSVRVGGISKQVVVVGNRFWKRSLLGEPSISDLEPFTTMDLVADRAFGGWGKRDWCLENPIGRGFIDKPGSKAVAGLPLPNLEDPANPIVAWHTKPHPTGLGVYGRDAMPRLAYAGRYPQDYEPVETDDPSFPPGFRLDFFNAAHRDLQVEGYLMGDEEVELVNLCPEGRLCFSLPGIRPKIQVQRFLEPLPPDDATTDVETLSDLSEDYDDEQDDADEEPARETVTEVHHLNLDTLCLFPDKKRFTQVWRGLLPVLDYETFDEEIAIVRITL